MVSLLLIIGPLVRGWSTWRSPCRDEPRIVGEQHPRYGALDHLEGDGADIDGHIARHGAETEGTVELTTGRQSDLEVDPATVKLKLHPAVEIEPKGALDRFTRWVRRDGLDVFACKRADDRPVQQLPQAGRPNCVSNSPAQCGGVDGIVP